MELYICLPYTAIMAFLLVCKDSLIFVLPFAITSGSYVPAG